MSRNISPNSNINRLNFISKMSDKFCRTLKKIEIYKNYISRQKTNNAEN